MRRSPRLPLEELQPYLLDVPVPPPGEGRPLDWRAVFGNDNPVEIEVGSGKGLFLVTTAPAHPDVNYLGVEIVRKYQLFTATRIARRGLGNVRMCCADARWLLRERVPSSSVRVVHVYFPDPWWKKRHHKRRVFTGEFAAQVARVLVPGGELRLATDVADYAAMARELVAAHAPLAPVPAVEGPLPGEGDDYLTNFERKARLEGREVHRLTYRKPEGA